MADAHAETVPAEIAYAGEWRLELAKSNRTANLTLRYPPAASNHSSPIALAYIGLTLEALGGVAHPVRFELRREAGTFVCEGFAEAGQANGAFRFEPDPEYASAIALTGLPPFTLRKHVIAAMFDASSSFIRAIVEADLPNVTFQQLIALKMFRIAHEDVGALHTAFPGEGLDDIVALAMMGVTPGYVEALRRANVGNLSADNVAALRASGVERAFVDGLAANARRGFSFDEVVRLHGSAS